MMRQHKLPFSIKILLAVIALIAAMAVSLSLGSSGIRLSSLFTNPDSKSITIITRIRIPRAIMAALVGGILASVGSVMQGIFKNPMADPSVLGISSGAALGATLAMVTGLSGIVLGFGFTGSYIGAMAGSCFTWILISSIAKSSGEYNTSSTLLAGISISSVMSAIITILMIFDRENLERVYMWMLGSFSAATFSKVIVLLIASLILMPVLIIAAPQIDILKLGDEAALTLGVKRSRILAVLLFTSSALIAVSVSSCGIIGFIGLIIPHLVTFFGVTRARQRLIMSFLIGAVFTLLCDTIAKTAAAPSELPIGAITSIIGGPYFLYLLLRSTPRAQK